MRTVGALAAVLAIHGMSLAGSPAMAADPDPTQKLESECLAGKSASCSALGAMFRSGDGVPKNAARSAIFYVRACAEGAASEGPYCREAGYGMASAAQSSDDSRELDAAVEGLAASCKSGKAHDCNALGVVRQGGAGSAKNPEEAVGLFARACEGGAAAGCGNLGDAYEAGLGVGKDPEKAVMSYVKACSGGYAYGCGEAGSLYFSGTVEGGLPKAAPLLRQGCDGRDPVGCFLSGMLAMGARGGEKNPLQAVRDFKKGCDLRFPRACLALVQIYREDAARATALFKEACGDDKEQCGEFDALVEGIQAGAALRAR